MDAALVPGLTSRSADNRLARARCVSGRTWFVVLAEGVLILVALLDTAPWTDQSATAVTFGFVSTAALALRRRFSIVTWLLCLPAVVTSAALIAPLIAVYSVARFTRSLVRVQLVVAVAFVANAYSAFHGDGVRGISSLAVLQTLVYCAVLSVGPAALGITYAARTELDAKLAELVISQQRERRLAAASAIAEERTRLAREMHDVVSHQVSLIALQAGALLADLRANRRLAVAFCRPTTDQTLQIKAFDAQVVALVRDDYCTLAEHANQLVAELAPIGFPEAIIRPLFSCSPSDAVAVNFSPSAVFDQTPGPNAGARVAGALAPEAD